MTALDFLLILVLGTTASFIGTMVGGSGLITIPGLIFLGLPPQTAIATDQVGLIGECFSGWFAFHRAKKIDYPLALKLAALTSAGALIGAATLVNLPADLVETLVGVLVLVIGVAIGCNKSTGVERPAEPSAKTAIVAGYAMYLVVGFWGGLFGAGFGLLSRYILLLSFRKTFIETAAIGKIIGISVAACAIPVFISEGLVDWLVTIPLLSGMTLGAFLGARYALKIGDRKLRILFLIIVSVSSLKLLLT